MREENKTATAQKRVMVDMSATLIHHGHIRLLKKAKELGHVVVALVTDEEVESRKGYKPELSYKQREEILLAMRYVDEVIPSPWLVDDEYMDKHNIDVLLHGEDNVNPVTRLQVFPRTEGIASSDLREETARTITILRNTKKCLVTPGPTNVHPSSLTDIRPVFSRDDAEYQEIEHKVLERILKVAGQDSIATLQGSATTAIEVATNNFLVGNVAVIVSGFYSQRMFEMIQRKASFLNLASVKAIDYDEFVANQGTVNNASWIVAAVTETADAHLSDVPLLKQCAEKNKARLMLDATGSINLEDHHELADVTMFSSCKGLGGLTGASFITYNRALLNNLNPASQPFILDLKTHIDKRVTCPASTICSMLSVSEKFDKARRDIAESKQIFLKKFEPFITRKSNQPNLCTMVTAKNIEYPPGTITYSPRKIEPGKHVICHLFDQFESTRKVGEFYDGIKMS